MGSYESLSIGTDVRRDVYRYIDHHGAVRPSMIAEEIGADPEEFRHHVSVLKRDDYIEELEDGRLRVKMKCGEAEEHETGGLEYVIRPAGQQDVSSILGVVREIAEEQVYLVAESVAEQLEYERVVRRRSVSETHVFFVATVEDDVVGWCQVEIPRMAKLSHTAELTLGVLVEYRRYSIGAHLLQRGMEWAASQDCWRVYCSLPETNDLAVSFLQEHGWRIEAVRSDHFEVDGEPVDEVMVAADLD